MSDAPSEIVRFLPDDLTAAVGPTYVLKVLSGEFVKRSQTLLLSMLSPSPVILCDQTMHLVSEDPELASIFKFSENFTF